jgi:hypothetical protein
MDKFFYKVPLKYNKHELFYSCKNIKSWPYYSNDNGHTRLVGTHDVLWPMNVEAYRIKNMLMESTNWSFSFIEPGSQTGWHTDKTRGATLIIPVDNTPHLIKFKDNNNEFEYYYDTPILTNAKFLHNGINYTNKPRYNLLFHFDTSYEILCNKIDNNTLFNTWIQYYRYYIDLKFDISLYIKSNATIDNSDFVITDSNINYPEKTVFIGNTTKEVYSNIKIINNYNLLDLVYLIKYITESPTRIRYIEI